MKTETKPFGFEFIRKAKFREINFGKQGGSDQAFNVAGHELSRPGFRLCKECGMVQHRTNKPEHLFKCQYKQAEGNEGIIECLYLYREYESEAIRILMPRLSIGAQDEQTDSFVAALQLGLKKRFGGKVDHLHITTSDEPIPGSTERAYYLVLYDSVPGGTGYLHELLTDSSHLMELLKESRDHMAACSCQHIPEQDGCYNCLYAYRNSYGMERTSRTTALEMLSSILDGDITLEPVTHLGKMRKDHWVDSELEARFPEAIQALNQHAALGGLRVRTSKDVINGKVGFRIEIGEHDYSVEIHPRLNNEHGVMYPCEPDFLIRSDRESDSIKPIAVFLDGYRYHKHIIHEDLMKRQGIFLSSGYITWSLTWHDVNYAFAGSEAKIPNVLRDHTEDSPKAAIRSIAVGKGLVEHDRIAEHSPLVLLLKYLSQPYQEFWQGFAAVRVLNWLDQRNMQDKSQLDTLRQASQAWPAQYDDQWTDKNLIFSTIREFGSAGNSLKLFIAGTADAVKDLEPSELVVASVIDLADVDSESAQTAWQKLLQLLNIGQFLPLYFSASQQGLNDGSFSQLLWGDSVVMKVTSSAWDAIKGMADEDLAPWLDQAAEKGLLQPSVAYELVDEKGMVIGEAELAWIDAKVALLLDYQVEDSKAAFENQGWSVVTQDRDIDVVMNLVGAQ